LAFLAAAAALWLVAALPFPSYPSTVSRLMSTNKVDVAATPSGEPKTPPPSSLVRLLVLLGILLLVIGVYGYDYLVAAPGALSGDIKIQELVDARNKMGVKEGSLVTSADIQKELGMRPTFVEKHPDLNYEIETYCWWGSVPFLNTRRHFISIVYNGTEPRHFSSHYRNEKPPEEALPIIQEPSKGEGVALPEPESPGSKSGEGSPSPEKGADAAAASPADAPPAEAKEAATDSPTVKPAGDKPTGDK
jgi:hypothetical protein